MTDFTFMYPFFHVSSLMENLKNNKKKSSVYVCALACYVHTNRITKFDKGFRGQ